MFARLILVLVAVVFGGNAFMLGTLAGTAAADAMTNGGWVSLAVGTVAALGAIACALWALVALLFLRVECYFQ